MAAASTRNIVPLLPGEEAGEPEPGPVLRVISTPLRWMIALLMVSR